MLSGFIACLVSSNRYWICLLFHKESTGREKQYSIEHSSEKNCESHNIKNVTTQYVTWAQLILQPFSQFTYVTAHSPTHSVALPTSQLILQPFRCFTYVTAHSPTLLSLLLRHRIFTYVTWRAAHEVRCVAIDWNTRDIAQHICAKLHPILTVVLISRPIGPWKKNSPRRNQI